MAISSKFGLGQGISGANVTPLADVTTTLIVVFLITMPTIMWNGIQVNATRAEANHEVVQRSATDQDDLLTIAVTRSGITVNRKSVALDELEGFLGNQLASQEDKTVVVVPSDRVELGAVVAVLDIAKASGAQHLALLNKKERG